MTSGRERFAKYITLKIESARGSRGNVMQQSEIAKALGYENANIVSLWKSGKTRVPIEIVPKLSRTIGVNTSEMLREALVCYYPNMLDAIEEYMTDVIPTNNESAMLSTIRKMTGNSDPAVDTDETIDALAAFCTALNEK